jgi:AraC family transcriptional activator of pobA
MVSSDSLLRTFSQHRRLPIRLVAPGFGFLPPDDAAHYGLTHRLAYYFFLFVWEGTATCGVDLEQVLVEPQDLLFALPHQIRQLPATLPGNVFYKLGLHHECLALLPRQYPFLLNPLHQPKVRFSTAAAARLRTQFDLLTDLLRQPDTAPDLILAQLHSLLTEINVAYFAAAPQPATERLAKFRQFIVFVEDHLTQQPTVGRIADALALSPDSLYHLVKHHAGLSPKEFITNRLILEAQRRLYYEAPTSVKELAFALGFQDPAYFCRLFKKTTGQTVAAFAQDLS